METQQIPLAELAISPLNARQTTNEKTLEELKASIKAHGLMQNLVVVNNGLGIPEVIAGGRRLVALQQLAAEGGIPKGYVVTCNVVPREWAAEMSLAENVVRDVMHPADEFEAFTALAKTGENATDIALRFGTTSRHVEQRLKMGKVHPDIVAEYRAGEIPLDCVMAFTISDNQDDQLSAFKSLKEWERKSPGNIRSKVTKKMIQPDSASVKLVGLDAYKAAGGRVAEDLFGDATYLMDKKILEELVDQKIQKQVTKLEKEGWGFIDVLKKFDWQTREFFTKVEAETKEAKKDAGCLVWLDGWHGEIKVEKGYVRKEVTVQPKATTNSTRGPRQDVDLAKLAAKDIQAEIVRVHLLNNPEFTMELLAFRAADCVFSGSTWASHSGLNVDFSTGEYNYQVEVEETETAAKSVIKEAHDELDLSWAAAENGADRFTAFRSLRVEEKAALLEYAAAVAFDFGTEDAKSASEAIVAHLNIDYRKHWTPTKATYFRYLSAAQMLEIATELFGKTGANTRAALDHDALAELLEATFADPFAAGLSAEQQKLVNAWLPKEMSQLATGSQCEAKKKAA